MQCFNQKKFNQNKKVMCKFQQKFRVLRLFLVFKTIFEKIKTKPDLENKINSNIDHGRSPVFLFYFKVPLRALISFFKMHFIFKLFLQVFFFLFLCCQTHLKYNFIGILSIQFFYRESEWSLSLFQFFLKNREGRMKPSLGIMIYVLFKTTASTMIQMLF